MSHRQPVHLLRLSKPRGGLEVTQRRVEAQAHKESRARPEPGPEGHDGAVTVHVEVDERHGPLALLIVDSSDQEAAEHRDPDKDAKVGRKYQIRRAPC